MERDFAIVCGGLVSCGKFKVLAAECGRGRKPNPGHPEKLWLTTLYKNGLHCSGHVTAIRTPMPALLVAWAFSLFRSMSHLL